MIERRSFVDILPKSVVNSIARYAREGRALRAVFEPHGGRLMAVAGGRDPVILLRNRSRERFAELRSAAAIEWAKLRRRLTPQS